MGNAAIKKGGFQMANITREEIEKDFLKKPTLTLGLIRLFVRIGTILATLISWEQWHSIGWALFQGLGSWVYVLAWSMGWVQRP
jgi:hypothetical protein